MNGAIIPQSELINELLKLLPSCSPKQQEAILARLEEEKQKHQRRRGDAPQALKGHDLYWQYWLERYFPHIAYHKPSAFHEAFWDWISDFQLGQAQESFVGCVFRGGGKSTTFELGATYTGVRLARRFALVVCETQEQADERVQACRSLFESINVGAAVTKQGTSKGWRRDQLRTENGFNLAGIGLDTAVRGIKFDEFRPDWIHLDDIDNAEDTPNAVKKKIRLVTRSIFKASVRGAAAISFCQNLIHDNSLMMRALGKLVSDDGFLLDARRVGPVNGFEDLKIERVEQPDKSIRFKIAQGRANWSGFTVEQAEHELNRDGKESFEREVQNDVTERGGGLWDGYEFRYWDDPKSRPDVDTDPNTGLPHFLRIVEAIDPSGSARGDEVGVIATGLFRLPSGDIGGIVLADKSGHMSPATWAKTGVNLYYDLGADVLRAESNFGGEMVEATIAGATIRDETNGLVTRSAPPVELIRASRGKIVRAEPAHGEYERGRVWHVRRFYSLENELKTWHPGSGLPSPGRLDALVFTLTDMTDGTGDWSEVAQSMRGKEQEQGEPEAGKDSWTDAYVSSAASPGVW